ncbi:50S ribosomal protein L37ae [Candidatus Pacearchaeota archaeon CG10_big_fil_rev_8_21_14_0_10_30_48]|nr:MAG: 50S ribosomal protein L37ae [Candidatus Pacearchaeota archaeon CG10_big_fil_rev_8_21_14_0_10_30_48]
MARTKKVKVAGKHRAGFGTRVRTKLIAVESKQRKSQTCPFCSKKGVKRKSAGIWFCEKCDKTFAGGAYYLE